MEDSPQKIRHTTGETYECDREFERNKGRTNVCNSADVEDKPHNGNRLGLGRLRSGGLGSGGWGRGAGVGGVGVGGLGLMSHLLCGESS